MVIPVDPKVYRNSSLFQRGEVVLPGTFFFKGSKEALNNTILLRSVWGNKFLSKSVESASFTKPAALEDKTIITSDCRSFSNWSQSPKPIYTCSFKSSLSLVCSTSYRQFISNDFSVAAINDRNQMTQAITSAGEVCNIHSPPGIKIICDAGSSLNSWPRSLNPLIAKPFLIAKDSKNPFPVYLKALFEPQNSPDPTISKRWVFNDYLFDSYFKSHDARLLHFLLFGGFPLPQRRTGDLKNSTDTSYRDARPNLFYSSDVGGTKGRPFTASLRISNSKTRSPIFALSRFSRSSLWASSSRGFERRAFSAPERNFSFQSSTSATVSPCCLAASCDVVSPRRIVRTRAARRFAVHRCVPLSLSSDIMPPPHLYARDCHNSGSHFKGSSIA